MATDIVDMTFNVSISRRRLRGRIIRRLIPANKELLVIPL